MHILNYTLTATILPWRRAVRFKQYQSSEYSYQPGLLKDVVLSFEQVSAIVGNQDRINVQIGRSDTYPTGRYAGDGVTLFVGCQHIDIRQEQYLMEAIKSIDRGHSRNLGRHYPLFVRFTTWLNKRK